MLIQHAIRRRRRLQVQNRFIFGENHGLRRVLADAGQRVHPSNE
jgi:hypothetical protein